MSAGSSRMPERVKSNMQLREGEEMEWKEIRRQIKEETKKARKEENSETCVCMYVRMYMGENLEGNCRELYFRKPSQINAKLPIIFVLSVRPSVYSHVSSQLPLDVFS